MSDQALPSVTAAAPAAAAASVLPPAVPPREEGAPRPLGKRRGSIWGGMNGARWLLVALLVGVVGVLAARYLQRPPEQLMPMQEHVLYTSSCERLNASEVALGYTLGEGTYDRPRMRNSLLHHMDRLNQSLLCALHLGVPLCYCVMYSAADMSYRRGPAPRPSQYTELFNPAVRLFVLEARSRTEQTPECPNTYNIRRFTKMTLNYFDSDGKPAEATYYDDQAADLQYALEYLYKLPSHCGGADGIDTFRAHMAATLGDSAPRRLGA
jgi:peptide deformylase